MMVQSTMIYHITLLFLGARMALAAIHVNVSTTYQTMDGFGFSQAFGKATHLYNLPATQRTHALDLLFSPTLGAGFTILRNRIGSGSTGDSILPTSPGSPSGSPTYVWDGSDRAQVWVSQQAKTYGVTRFYANAWSAPGFMKTTGDEANGGHLCGVSGQSCSSGDWKSTYAQFLIQYIKYYASVGIDINYIGFVNEPDAKTSYSSMLSTGTQAADFIKVLHPALAAAGLSSVGITCCDMMGWKNQITATAELISAGVESMLSRITSHGYTSDPTSKITTSRPTWMSEKENVDDWNANWYTSGGSISDGYTWANNIHTGIIDGGVSAYFYYWEGIQITTTNVALIQISGTTVTTSGRLWAYALWSRYVRPGAVRVSTYGAPTGVKTSAFKNTDGTVSVQVINTNSVATGVEVATTGFVASSVKGYVVSQSNIAVSQLSAQLSDGIISATIPAYGMATFVLTAGSSSSVSSTKTATSTYKSTSTSSRESTATSHKTTATSSHKSSSTSSRESTATSPKTTSTSHETIATSSGVSTASSHKTTTSSSHKSSSTSSRESTPTSHKTTSTSHETTATSSRVTTAPSTRKTTASSYSSSPSSQNSTASLRQAAACHETRASFSHQRTKTTSSQHKAVTLKSGIAVQTLYGQCGGKGWTGPTTCVTRSTCKYTNEYFSQCL